MRLDVVWSILRREALDLARNRLLLAAIFLPPVALTLAPLTVGALVQGEALPPGLAGSLLEAHPEWRGLSPSDLALAYGFQQFLLIFLMMPAFIPLTIATFSIIGEKQSRSLEAVLATPIRTIELLAGKSLAALVPGILGGFATYGAFFVLARRLYGPTIGSVVSDGSWLAAVFLLGPAVGLASVVLGVIVSSRSNDPRTAQQIGALIILPLVGLTVLQATGTVFVGAGGYALGALFVAGLSLVGLRAGVWLFDREAILTRWR